MDWLSPVSRSWDFGKYGKYNSQSMCISICIQFFRKIFYFVWNLQQQKKKKFLSKQNEPWNVLCHKNGELNWKRILEHMWRWSEMKQSIEMMKEHIVSIFFSSRENWKSFQNFFFLILTYSQVCRKSIAKPSHYCNRCILIQAA